MTTPSPPAQRGKTAAIKGLPSRYAKAIAAAIGQAIFYLQLYGATWHLVPALTGIGVILGVLGVPNAPKPGQPA